MISDDLADEARRARKVRQLVDIATTLIIQSRMTRRDAEKLVQTVRGLILRLFPGSAETFEIVYARRFSRLIREFAIDGSVEPDDHHVT